MERAADISGRSGTTAMEIHVRQHLPPNHRARYYASFERAEIKDGACLVSTFGDGAWPGEAVMNYSREISGKLLVINAYDQSRREIRAPWFHTGAIVASRTTPEKPTGTKEV